MALNMELHARQLLLYPILQNIDEGIIITDPALNIIFFNKIAESIFQIKSNQIIGQKLNLLLPFNLDALLKSGQKTVQEAIINGKEVLITKGLIELEADQVFGYVILRPTDRFKDMQLNSLLQSPYEGIAIFNENCHLIYANETCFNFFSSQTLSELYHELANLVPRTSLEECMAKNKPYANHVIQIQGQSVQLILLPIAHQGRTRGVIVKSSLSYRPQRSWEHLVDEYHQGTANYYLNSIIGNHPSLKAQKELATRASRTTSTVLIVGDSGTGKEIFAHAIHNMSPRRKGPFIKVNCAAVPETLLESELFGYADGAFTGARKDGKPGKFELANYGTIFLDEIGDMSLSMQAKLLRVLQEKEVERVGSLHITRINVRVIAATNQDLKKLVAEGLFREDLYYRLNVIILNLPPLRERREDIPLLSQILLERLNQQLGTKVEGISSEVINLFYSYDWPGNVRELENTIERAINFCDGHIIRLEHLPPHLKSNLTNLRPPRPQGSLENLLEEKEREVIINTLKTCEGNKTKAARALNIHRSALYRKINKYNIRL
ncbi:sigma 54-interacting transcriptional regulator [Syntrophomonas erecta]